MRGSTLLFHSLEALDPVCFDRVDDIEEALEPELTYTGDRHRQVNHHNERSSGSLGKSHHTPRKSQEITICKSRRSGRPVPLNLDSDLSCSCSPPLTKSNYYVGDPEFKENQWNTYSYEERRGSRSSTSSTDSDHSTGSVGSDTTTTTPSEFVIGRKNIMSFHNHSGRQVDGRKMSLSSIGSGMPLSRLRSERSGGGHLHSFGISHNAFAEQSRSSHHHESGLSKFFSGLKSNKSDKNRFDVNNLPPQLKSELKNIYVY